MALDYLVFESMNFQYNMFLRNFFRKLIQNMQHNMDCTDWTWSTSLNDLWLDLAVRLPPQKSCTNSKFHMESSLLTSWLLSIAGRSSKTKSPNKHGILDIVDNTPTTIKCLMSLWWIFSGKFITFFIFYSLSSDSLKLFFSSFAFLQNFQTFRLYSVLTVSFVYIEVGWIWFFNVAL